MSPEVFRDILYSLAGLALGACGYATIAHLITIRRTNEIAEQAGQTLVELSWLLTVGAVFVTILVPLTSIPPTVAGWVFATGLGMGFVGFALVARNERRRFRAQQVQKRRKSDQAGE